MAILWINLAVVYMCSLFARFVSKPALIGSNMVVPNKLFVCIALASLILVSGLRSNIGDTVSYTHSYVVGAYTWADVIYSRDFGFNVLQMLLKTISADPLILIFTTALITNLFIVMVLYKYSRLLDLSIYVYITSGLYIVSMNGIRQFLAAALIFAATRYIFNGNWLKFMMVALLACTIHQSAFILIPIYFICRRKAWTTGTFLLILFAIVLALGYNQLTDILFSAIQDTQYGHYKDAEQEGANVIRVAVQAVPILFAFLGRKQLREFNPQSDYIVNLSIIGLLFMIIATQNWIFARFIIYFGLYNLLLISWVVKAFAKRYQTIIYYAVVVLYFVYFYYENKIVLGLIYRSNYLNM